jgi:septum formation topological specificity factor MinE
MTDKVTFLENDKIDEHIQIIMRQTDYDFETAKQKLEEYNYDYLTVIKKYVGVAEKKEPHVKSVNQEIYKQIRHKLDASMREYNERKEKE